MPSNVVSPAGGLVTSPQLPPQLLVTPPAMAPSDDCSHWVKFSCVVRLVAQSALAVGESGIRLVSVDRAHAASGFCYPCWIDSPLIRQDQAPVLAPPQA